jgi:hypothetical protein
MDTPAPGGSTATTAESPLLERLRQRQRPQYESARSNLFGPPTERLNGEDTSPRDDATDQLEQRSQTPHTNLQPTAVTSAALNPYSFNASNNNGADSKVIKDITNANGAYTASATFKGLKIAHQNGVIDLAKFIDSVTEILARHNVEALGAAAHLFREYRKHAKRDEDRPIQWTEPQWKLINQWWGSRLRELALSNKGAIPRLAAITADESITAPNRNFTQYLDAILQEEGGAQLRVACTPARTLMALKSPNMGHGWSGAADALEAIAQDVEDSGVTVQDLVNDKLVELLPQHFLTMHPALVDGLEPGAGRNFTVTLLRKLRQLGRLTDERANTPGHDTHNTHDTTSHAPLQDIALALTDAQVKELPHNVSLPDEQWKSLTRTQQVMIINKRNKHKATPSNGSNQPATPTGPDGAASEGAPAEHFCITCGEQTKHRSNDCPHRYSQQPHQPPDVLAVTDSPLPELQLDVEDIGLDGWEMDDYDDFESNLERVACVTLQECTTFNSHTL